MDKEKDSELVCNALRGDREAFNLIYTIYHVSVYNYVYYHIMEKNFAEDLVQETFVTFLQNLTDFDGTKTIIQSLITIAKYHVYNKNRKKIEFNIEGKKEKQEMNPNPEEQIIINEKLNMVAKQIDKLDPKVRATFLEHVLGGKSISQIAYEEDIPEGTVKSRIARARIILNHSK